MKDPKFAEFEDRITALEIKAGIKKAPTAKEVKAAEKAAEKETEANAPRCTSGCEHAAHTGPCPFTDGDMYCTCGEVVDAADAAEEGTK